VALEDLHWVDTTSDEVIAFLVESLAAAPVLLVVTYRPGYQAAWLARSYATQLSLAPLSGDDSLVVLRSALDRAAPPPETLAVLAGRGDGNPFFLEELARAFAEQGPEGAPLAVPGTIHGVLMGRIDRLPAADRRILQAAAVVGRTVPLSVLHPICHEPETALRASLDRLRAAEFLHETRAHVYTFKHSLTQEVAYGTLVPEERREWHSRVADELLQAGPDAAERRPEVVARHLTAAQRTAEAIPRWLAAGRSAIRRSANVEAVSHLKSALGLLASQPATVARDAAELELQLTLGVPLIMTQGYASAEVESVYRRAEALCAQMSDTPELFSALWGVSVFHVVRGDLHSARAVAERLLAVATRSGRDDLRVEAHLAFGAAMFHQGLLAEAREHLARSDELYDPERHADHAFLYGQDPQVAALCFLCRTLLLLGGDDAAAVRCIERALRRADALDHPFSRAFAHLNAAALYELLGDWRTALPYIDQAIALATEHRFLYLLGGGVALRGQVLVSEGRYAEGLALIRQGLDTWRATGATLSLPYYLGVTAAALHAAGDSRRGLPLVVEALDAVGRSGEFISEPELHRIHGELLAADAATEAAAPAAFERARRLAEAHGARLFTRRAEASLARYLRDRRHDPSRG
jgi:predicted ATPase